MRKKHEMKHPMSGRMIKNQVNNVFRGPELKICIRWLDNFLNRHEMALRRVTTAAPENCTKAMAKFIVHVKKLRKKMSFSQVFAMNETAVWFDCSDGRYIETKGAKDVTVVTTGHEKMRVALCPAEKSYGRKLLPYWFIE